jgi:hypothetical protein
MKTTIYTFLVVILWISTVPLLGQDDGLPPKTNKALIEDNLLIGLASDNQGLKKSCALMLGQIYSKRATIPLMSILRDSENRELRIAAAWSLCRIGSDVGTYFVRSTVRFDDDPKVKAFCAWYYDLYVQKGVFLIRQTDTKLFITERTP